MNTLLLFISVWSTGHFSIATEPDIVTLRTLFYAAESSKNAWVKMTEVLEPLDHTAKPIYLCYIGVSEMMGAKYVVSPIAKLNRFKKGKMMIEKAVEKAPEDLEIRFLRFSVQTNLPSFLGYDSDIHTDKKVLLEKLDEVTDKGLKNNIFKYLSSSKYCTAEEKKMLMK